MSLNKPATDSVPASSRWIGTPDLYLWDAGSEAGRPPGDWIHEPAARADGDREVRRPYGSPQRPRRQRAPDQRQIGTRARDRGRADWALARRERVERPRRPPVPRRRPVPSRPPWCCTIP